MSLLKTIFKIPVKAQIAFLKLDASIRESHDRVARVSDHDVEDGTVISDHIKIDPRSLTIEGQISNDPISILGLGVSTDDILGAANDFADGDKSSFEGLVKNSRRTPKEAFLYLNDLMTKRTPFSVVTSLNRYKNLVITNLSIPRTAKNGKDLLFTATLRQIVIVKSATVTIPSFKTAKSSATSKAGLGKQSTKGASAKQTDDSSLLLKGFKKVGIF